MSEPPNREPRRRGISKKSLARADSDDGFSARLRQIEARVEDSAFSLFILNMYRMPVDDSRDVCDASNVCTVFGRRFVNETVVTAHHVSHIAKNL